MDVKIEDIITGFENCYHKKPECYIDAGGRYEILGNHTDHNHGLCLVANASLRIRACVSKHPTKVQIKSKGYVFFEFDVNNLELDESNPNKTMRLIQGVIFKIKDLGYKVGGFSIFMDSEIPDGSGVSSSAAVESLFGFVISHLYNNDKIDDLTIAKVGKYSENNYFGKPSGLLDQIGTSFGDFNFLDFENIDEPKIETLDFNLPVDIFLIKSSGNHANLTPLYAAIPSSMYDVAHEFNVNFLREVKVEDPIAEIEKLNIDEAKKRKAKHFFNENKVVLKGKKAIEENDLEGFFEAVRESQESSKNNLENTYVKEEYKGSPQYILDKIAPVLGNNGAARIHGGGFKGTVIVFVKKDYSDTFAEYLDAHLKRYPHYKVNFSKKEANIIDF